MNNRGKRVKINGATVITPWLRGEEAAAYCGMSRTTFYQKQKDRPLPTAGEGRGARYYAPVLDEWMKRMGNGETGNAERGMRNGESA